ncbi:MAG: ribonuclease P protein component [Ignavibacteriaceae bacterium]|nr:ribonuclease P protein component [Ignavibacteriaceae bacterium]
MKPFSFGKNERIKEKKLFEKLYTSGKISFSSNKKIKAVYFFVEDRNADFPKVAVAVSKKAGNAFWRNRVKRLLREAYRLNKLPISSFCKEKKKQLFIVFSPFLLNQKENKTIGVVDVIPGVQEMLSAIIRNEDK